MELEEYAIIGLFVLCLVVGGIALYGIFTKPSMGYGGSPGHMSPMEVEALYEKNKK